MADDNPIDALFTQLEAVVAEISSSTNLAVALFARNADYAGMLAECIGLQQRLRAPALSDDAFFTLKAECLAFIRRYRLRSFLIVTVPAVLAMALALLAVLACGWYFDWPGMLAALFNKGGVMILIGFLGVLMSVSTTILRRTDDSAAGQLRSIATRLVLAMIVPVTLVLLFVEGGRIKTEVRADDPAIVAFVCGYSAQLLMDVLNKVVAKVAKVIEAI
jgi:hypothetical protein